MKQQLRALIVEDSEDDALLLVRQLQDAGYEVHSERVELASSFVAALEGKEWDIILSDSRMPRFNGLKALSIVMERGIDVPFIFVSGTMGEERAVEAMKAGANDYVIKGNTKRLVPAVERELREAKDRKAHRHADEALIASEARYRRLFETAQDGILILDAESGAITDANPYLTESLGYSLQELMGKRLWEIGAFADVKDSKAAFEELRRKEYIRYNDLPLKTKDGQSRQVEFVSNVYLVDGKKVIQCNIRDVTERKRSEREIESLSRFPSESPNPVLRVKEDGQIIFANTASKALLQLWKCAVGGPLPFDWRERIIHAVGDGARSTVEVACEERTYSVTIAPIPDAGYVNLYFLDMTEGKHAEETRKSLEAQLQQAQKLESIGTLASGIAHDFNNILAIILGYSTILERRKGNPAQLAEGVAVIKKATLRGASLVKQLLVFARKTDALLEIVSINDMIGEITKLLKDTFPKTITVSTSLQEDLPSVVADVSQIHQVLLNLCVNARDAMPKSGTLSISTAVIDGAAVGSRFAKAAGYPVAGRYVQIEVADTGTGMDERTRRRIFEPFFTTKPPGKGTGLGLAVVYGIIEHHNGFIDVRSAPDAGTTFTAYFPVPERALEELQVSNKGPEEIPGGTETILVIEDEEMLRELVKACLISKGYSVLIAEDGIQGVAMYRSHQKEIAVVLSDMGLPLLGGQDVFKQIREINPEAKVIFASGFLDPEMKADMYKAGLREFIQKPYMEEEVLQKIRVAIDTKV